MITWFKGLFPFWSTTSCSRTYGLDLPWMLISLLCHQSPLQTSTNQWRRTLRGADLPKLHFDKYAASVSISCINLDLFCDLVTWLFDLWPYKSIGFCTNPRCICVSNLVKICQCVSELCMIFHPDRQTSIDRQTVKWTSLSKCKFWQVTSWVNKGTWWHWKPILLALNTILWTWDSIYQQQTGGNETWNHKVTT